MTAAEARFVELYERFYRSIYGYCRRRTTADRVDDAVADTFLTVWRKIDDVPTGDRCLPWLYGVAYRVLGHQWRGAARRRSLLAKLSSIGVDPLSVPDDYIVMRHESQLVLTALTRLKPVDQEILRMTTWEELPQSDVAEALGISVGAVRQRLYQARKNLTREYRRLEGKGNETAAAQKGGAQ